MRGVKIKPTAEDAKLARRAYPDRKTHFCTNCGHRFPEASNFDTEDHFTYFGEDPYQSEYGDHSKSWQCGKCRYESAMDI